MPVIVLQIGTKPPLAADVDAELTQILEGVPPPGVMPVSYRAAISFSETPRCTLCLDSIHEKCVIQ